MRRQPGEKQCVMVGMRLIDIKSGSERGFVDVAALPGYFVMS